jgi:hypothetical protein
LLQEPLLRTQLDNLLVLLFLFRLVIVVVSLLEKG